MRSSERGAASPPTSRGGDGQAVRLAFTSRGRARESPGKQNRDEETNLSNERKTEFRDRPFHPRSVAMRVAPVILAKALDGVGCQPVLLREVSEPALLVSAEAAFTTDPERAVLSLQQ